LPGIKRGTHIPPRTCYRMSGKYSAWK
jgi:hypothetical protein